MQYERTERHSNVHTHQVTAVQLRALRKEQPQPSQTRPPWHRPQQATAYCLHCDTTAQALLPIAAVAAVAAVVVAAVAAVAAGGGCVGWGVAQQQRRAFAATGVRTTTGRRSCCGRLSSSSPYRSATVPGSRLEPGTIVWSQCSVVARGELQRCQCECAVQFADRCRRPRHSLRPWLTVAGWLVAVTVWLWLHRSGGGGESRST